jgi:hypothetical protein
MTDDIRTRHVDGAAFQSNTCFHGPTNARHECGRCDTTVVLDALDKAEAALAEMGRLYEAHLNNALEQRDAARADAERLALHLRNAIADLIGDWELLGGPQMRYADADAALAAHDALLKEDHADE